MTQDPSLQPRRQLSLNAFMHDTGHHEASWRHPDSSAERIGDVAWFQDIARKAEAAKLDAVFLADGPALVTEHAHRPGQPVRADHPADRDRGGDRAHRADRHRVDDVLRALQPGPALRLARPHLRRPRRLEHRDDVQRGRGAQLRARRRPDERGALRAGPGVRRRASASSGTAGRTTPSLVDRAVRHLRRPRQGPPRSTTRAASSRSAGPFNAPRSPQGRPVYIQAGSSNEGRAFAARNAEAIFTAHQTLADAQAFYADIKTKARGFGRNPDHVKILPGISPFIARHRGRGRGALPLLQRAHGPGVRPRPAREDGRRLAAPPRARRAGPGRGLRRRRQRARQQPQPQAGRRQHRRARPARRCASCCTGSPAAAATTSCTAPRCRSPTPSRSGSRAARPTAST